MNGPIQSEEALFEAALRIASAAERAAWLDQACAGQPELRRRVDQLLAAHDRAETFLDKPAAPNPPTVRLSLPDEEALGTMIGRYKLLEKVGEGGFGVVYVAEQREPVKRRVALKIIKLGMDTRQVVARFEAERQALALMDHPNIAKVLDAGATDNGRPYFVMELVRGIKVTEYCDQNLLSTRDRLGLFIQICHAIQHAHQKGIIHRDIKPSNILVTLHDGVPVPKVIDFGIAKATQQELTDKTLYTQLQQFIGTPAYMSPEQAEMSGLDIDTRSDVYSLGVLLYELLTGRTPFDQSELVKAGVDGMRKTIREKEPVRPSTRVATLQGEELSTTAARHAAEAPRLINLLRGDLDWIVMKCLEKDRTRRFETANGLAMDLKRHLNNEPVTARPPGRFYRFQKSVRRNKLAFAAAGAVAAALVIGLGISVFLYLKENEAYQRAVAARREADKARDNERKQHQLADSARGQLEVIISFMMQDLQPALEQSGRLPLLRQIAEKAVHYYEGLPAELRDSKMEFGHACALAAMARVHQLSGDRGAAEAALRQSVEILRRVAADNPHDPDAAAISLRLNWWWEMDFAGNRTTAEYDLSQRNQLQRWRQLRERFPGSVAVKKGLATTLVIRGLDSAAMFRNPTEAIAAATEGRALLAELLAADPDDRLTRALESQSLVSLGIAYEAMNQRDKSVQFSEEALAHFEMQLKSDPGGQSIRASAAEAARFLSYRVAAVSLKQSRDAELAARNHYRLLADLDPANAEWRHGHAWTHLMECYYLQADGQLEAARQAFKTFDSLLQPVAVNRPDREKLVDICAAQASLAAAAGDVEDARAHLATGESRAQAYGDTLPAGSFDRLQVRVRWLNSKSDPLLALRDWTGLEGVARQTLTAIEEGLRVQPADGELIVRRAVAEGYLGTALLRQGNAPAALPILEAAVTGYREAPTAPAFTQDREAFATATAEFLAEALAQSGDIPRARSLLETAFALRESRLAHQPGLWEPREALAKTAVLLASVGPSTAEDAVRRRQLLDRAASILNGPEAAGRLSVSDQELKAQIDSSLASLSTRRTSP